MAGVIDKSTKISLWLLIALLPTVFVGAVFLSNLNASIKAMDGTMHEFKSAIDGIRAQIIHDGKALVVLETQFQALERRVLVLEQKK